VTPPSKATNSLNGRRSREVGHQLVRIEKRATLIVGFNDLRLAQLIDQVEHTASGRIAPVHIRFSCNSLQNWSTNTLRTVSGNATFAIPQENHRTETCSDIGTPSTGAVEDEYDSDMCCALMSAISDRVRGEP